MDESPAPTHSISFFSSLSDPRLFQIFALGILLSVGAYFRDFSIRPAQVLLTFAAGLVSSGASGV